MPEFVGLQQSTLALVAWGATGLGLATYTSALLTVPLGLLQVHGLLHGARRGQLELQFPGGKALSWNEVWAQAC